MPSGPTLSLPWTHDPSHQMLWGCRPAQLLAQPFAAMLSAVEEANMEAAMEASRRAERGAAAPPEDDMAPPGGSWE